MFAPSHRYVALDCECVVVEDEHFPGRSKNVLARCAIVDYNNKVLLDIFVNPNAHVVDYLTEITGLGPHSFRNAVSFQKAQREIQNIIENKIVVGHTVKCDFKFLQVYHPIEDVRDIVLSPRLRELAGYGQGSKRLVSLRELTYSILGKTIQSGYHSPVEDAKAAMEVFRAIETEWDWASPKPSEYLW